MVQSRADATAVLVMAAGRGERAGGPVPKQYHRLGGKAVLARALQPFLDHPSVGRALVVIDPSDLPLYEAVIAPHPKLGEPVSGGATRQDSVRRGLAALAGRPPEAILIHDGARPSVTPQLIDRVIAGLRQNAAVLPVVPVADTVKTVAPDGIVTGTIPRESLALAQTPQGFAYGPIAMAHEAAAAGGRGFTDDAGLAEWAGMTVATVPGDPANRKITTAEDLAETGPVATIHPLEALLDVRVGTGYDVHAFADEPGDAVVLGGVSIPHGRKLLGHSDADVALHALTDAILGALAEGDIGHFFPPSDKKWRNAASEIFLKEAIARLAARGGRLAHLDLVVVAETPKIGPHRDAMRARIAAICGVPPGRVAVKATTNEKLGFVGRSEGIAAIATATIRLPFRSGE